MQLRDIIQEIDKSNPGSADFNDISSEVGVDCYFCSDYDKFESHLKAYYIYTWNCTDSWVGYMAYFLDDEFVMTSFQPGRKCDKRYSFASREAFDKVRDFMLQFVKDKEPSFSLVNLDEEVLEYQSVDFADQLVYPYADYKGEQVRLANRHLVGTDWSYVNQNVEIEKTDGTKEIVKVEELQIPINLEKTKDYRDWDRARANR